MPAKFSVPASRRYGYSSSKEQRQAAPRVVDHLLGLQSQIATRASRIYTIAAVKITHSVVNNLRFGKSGGCVIKINKFVHLHLRNAACLWDVADSKVAL